ncbi:MAG: copper oxidase [Bdellovibrionota bacterium]
MENERISRRDLLIRGGAALAGSALVLRSNVAIAAEHELPKSENAASSEYVRGSADSYLPVTVPNGGKLPYKMVDGVKVFHLVAEEVDHEFAHGLRAQCWGYNGSVHGPTIEAVEGDRVRIFVTNRLPVATTVHFHGVLVENGMDGVGGMNQAPIGPGETFRYEFTLEQHGTLMYHSHHDEMTQIALGMTGMFVVHPRDPKAVPEVDRDFAIMLHEWRVDPGARRPDPIEMTEFNLLTMNAKCYPATAPLVVRKGDRVRIRLGNLSPMDHHPIHLHGFQFKITETDGGRIPEAAQWPETTVLVPTGSTRTIEFIANREGDWAMHCHMTHHLMTQMGHQLPNLIGTDIADLDSKIQKVLPDYMTMGGGDMGDMQMPVPPNSIPMVMAKGLYGTITMGGMFTILKVREGLTSFADPGWYRAPAQTLARRATAEELSRDGINVRTSSPKGSAKNHS